MTESIATTDGSREDGTLTAEQTNHALHAVAYSGTAGTPVAVCRRSKVGATA